MKNSSLLANYPLNVFLEAFGFLEGLFFPLLVEHLEEVSPGAKFQPGE